MNIGSTARIPTPDFTVEEPQAAPAPAGGRPAIGAARRDAFSEHFDEAIAMNQERKSLYARLSGGRSTEVSDRLIATGLLGRVLTGALDAQAQRFNDRGIPIIKADVVSMSGVAAPEAPLKNRGVTPKADLLRVQNEVCRFHARVLFDLAFGRFDDIADSAYVLVREIEATEALTRSNLALTKHIVESIGIGALHAARYSKMSRGETDCLAKQFLSTQSHGLVTALETDRLAQPAQARGVGILVNDLPPIPFQEEWRAAHPK